MASQPVGKRVVALLTDIDRLMGSNVAYLVVFFLAVVVVYAYATNAFVRLDVALELVGIIAGIGAVFVIYKNIDQEKNIQFFQGEKVILESKTPKTYAMLAALGDVDLPPEPIRANIYLTNMGVLAERPGTGEAAIFIPLDRITDFGPEQAGIRIRYVDVRYPFAEALIFVDDRNRWMQELFDVINGRKKY